MQVQSNYTVPLSINNCVILCGFSDIHHLGRDWHAAQRCHIAASQQSPLPGGHHGLLLPPGPQAKEDLSSCARDMDTRSGQLSTDHIKRGCKVWIVVRNGDCSFI